MARKPRKTATDKFQEIVDSVCEALERGVAPWTKPWDGSFSLPRNGQSGRHYNGINIFLLWATSAIQGYTDDRWYTFDQAMTLNGFRSEWTERKRYGKTRKVRSWVWDGEGEAPCSPFDCGVRKGEKSTAIIWAGNRKVEDVDDDTGEVTERWFRSFKVWRVFNHQQIEWVKGREPADDCPIVDPAEGHKAAESLFAALPADVRHGGGVSAYHPTGDFISLPKPGAFTSVDAYWSTRAHETVHWTGHRNRCDRKLDTRFGSEAYAYEELVAELGAAFLCAEVGITTKLQHVEYIGSWIKVLRSDTKALFRAASDARKALDWIKGDEQAQAANAASVA